MLSCNFSIHRLFLNYIRCDEENLNSPPGGLTLNRNNSDSNYRFGNLPSSAPLATAYVPMQDSASPSYESMEALSRGTLFPGLDLPFMNFVNDTLEATPLTEMQAIDFVVDELELYLDTHADDKEAFDLYQTMLALQQEARERYVKVCGPIQQTDMLGMKSYTWLSSPWPWDYQPRMEV